MKKLFTFLMAFTAILSYADAQVGTQKIVGDSTGVAGQYIYRNRTLGTDKIHLLEDLVYVQNGATLTIMPGALIKGSGKGTIIVGRGAKIVADGKKGQPIVFTSAKAVGARTQGDWGGIILLGKAPNNGTFNNVKGEMQIEGGVQDAYGNAIHGGTDASDNSGILRYVRLEFGGFAFSANNEINGLTMGSVGKGTTIENVQCSFINDDSFEWFGGTVNAKNLISFSAVDDDFDTDNGYIGNVQFGYVLRNILLFDGGSNDSNGFESDNNSGGTYVTPFTAPSFSNITVVGPRASASTDLSLTNFNHAARIRRSSRNGIFNSILMGFKNSGLRIENTTGKVAAGDSTALLLNTIIPRDGNGNIGSTEATATTDLAAGGGILAYIAAAARANDTTKTVADLMLNDPFNLQKPNPTPKVGSPVLTGAAFTNARLTDVFFDKTVTFRGAFGATNWMDGWANFRPDTMKYEAPLTASLNDLASAGFEAKIYPNPSKGQAIVEFNIEKAMSLDVQVLDILGRTVKSVKNQLYTEGVNTLFLDLSEVAKGMYFVRFISNEANAQKTITLSITE